jgi:hypothetical protein
LIVSEIVDQNKCCLQASDNKADDCFHFLQIAITQAKQAKQQQRLMRN